VQSDRSGPGVKVHRWICAKKPKGRHQNVTDEVRVIDEAVRSITAADFATKHCSRLYWKEGEERKLIWPSLARMEPL